MEEPLISVVADENLVRNDHLTIVIFSGDLDKVTAALNIANGAAAMGMKTTLFFTFWGLNVLRKRAFAHPRSWLQRLWQPLNRGGIQRMPLSKLNFGGLGAFFLRKVMKRVNVLSPETLLAAAHEEGVRIVACTVTMATLGLEKTDLRQDLIDDYAGVITYLETARQGSVNLFV